MYEKKPTPVSQRGLLQGVIYQSFGTGSGA
jgi:hypothetical protein